MAYDVPSETDQKGGLMDLLGFLLFLSVYFALQLWILPKLGIST
jgi:hypothetical protein